MKKFLSILLLLLSLNIPLLLASLPSQRGSNICYIDMGILYGSYVIEKCVHCKSKSQVIDKIKIDAFLNPFFDRLLQNGMSELLLSFAQICDIGQLEREGAGTQRDTITTIFKHNYLVSTTQDNFLKYFINKAHQRELKVGISFGGALATEKDMKLHDYPARNAFSLASFMRAYNFDIADFDIEGGGLCIMRENHLSDITTFFSTLKEALALEDKKTSLTVAGSLQNGPMGTLSPLFEDFEEMFDGLNLMLYSSSNYYLDATHPEWGIQEWLNHVSNPSKIHIGFYDSIAYENPNTSGGIKYNISPGLSRGQASACIYKELVAQLGLTLDQMGNYFWWTDNPINIANNPVLSDFYQALTH